VKLGDSSRYGPLTKTRLDGPRRAPAARSASLVNRPGSGPAAPTLLPPWLTERGLILGGYPRQQRGNPHPRARFGLTRPDIPPYILAVTSI
jgi:hypothetical protein